MATDPIRRVRAVTHPARVTLDGHDALARLAALPPSPSVPYLTVSLDWRPEGASPGRQPVPEPRPSERRSGREAEGAPRRPARREIERPVRDLVDAHGPRGIAFDRLGAAMERIERYLDEEVDPAAQGVFLVAGGEAGVFEAVALGLPLPTRLRAGPILALSALANLVDDFPPYAVLVADQREAILSTITKAVRGQSIVLEASDYPRKQQSGGWSQRRFQARADERVAAFARGIAEATERALREAGITRLVVAGDEIITSALDDAFSATVRERIVGSLRLDIGASEVDLIAATQPVVERAEREAEAEAVLALGDAVGAGARGIEGIAGVLAALHAGQVELLVMNDDFAATGWADFGLAIYGLGAPPPAHPTGGELDDIVPLALEEEAIRLALQTGAEIQIVATASEDAPGADGPMIPRAGSPRPRTPAAASLDALGGVGVLLRFTVGEETSPISSIALGNGRRGRAAVEADL